VLALGKIPVDELLMGTPTEIADDSPRPEAVIECSVVVPVLNEERFIEQSVAAMQRQRCPGPVEFLFADGGSQDRTPEILARLARTDPRIRVFDNPNRYQSSGLNVALAHARGRWVVRMDAHTEYPQDYIALGIARLQRNGTRWVSGPQAPKGHGRISRAICLALGSPLGRGGSRKWGGRGVQPGDEYELDAGVFGGVWERNTLLEYGGWDERSSPNEDSELAARFLARGERLICLRAMAADYFPRDSLRGLWRQYRRYGEYRTRTATRHPHTMRRSHLLCPALVLDAALAMGGPRRTRRLARIGLGLYSSILLADGVRALPRATPRSDALLVPVVMAVMHSAFGAGAWYGAARHGVPAAALASAVCLDGLADSLAPAPEPVFAPSLRREKAAPEVPVAAARFASAP
jgi:succinoglycan biosynthesis protein ExoA